MKQGLRQGNPISPLLFNIVLEYLQVPIVEACDRWILKGASVNGDETSKYLFQHSHDSLLFSEWS